MSHVNRDTPGATISEILDIYGGTPSDSIPFFVKLKEATEKLTAIIDDSQLKNYGIVMCVEGTWGSGKTTFVNLLCDNVKDLNVATVKFDSLYYGNVSEATNIFIKSIFDLVKEKYGVRLDSSGSIAKNITPRFELANGIPKFTLDFTHNRETTEIIKDEISHKLSDLPGKIMIIVDDLDRVAAKDVVHFLRLIRVLREIPNFIILLPIDRLALERLLKSTGIEAPKKYLHKIFDEIVDISPDINSSRELFNNLIRRAVDAEENISQAVLEETWNSFLWQIALITIKVAEIELGDSAVTMQTQPNETNRWQPEHEKIKPLYGNSDIVREFFIRTSRAYGSDSNFDLRLINSTDPNDVQYRHYNTLYGGVSFSNFITGNGYANLSGNLHVEDSTASIYTQARWYRDADLRGQPHNTTSDLSATDYTFDLSYPSNPSVRDEHFAQFNSTSTLRDYTADLAAQFLPADSIQYLAPRTIKKICAQINTVHLTDVSNSPAGMSADNVEMLHTTVKNAVQTVIIADE